MWAGVNLPEKLNHFGICSVGQVEESLKSKLVDESGECFNEFILVDFFC